MCLQFSRFIFGRGRVAGGGAKLSAVTSINHADNEGSLSEEAHLQLSHLSDEYIAAALLCNNP